MSQQTAVDWLVKIFNLEEFKTTIEFAKAKEKEQIIDAFNSGLAYDYDEAETYYKKTYINRPKKWRRSR
jgi:hypothetical protein